MSAVTTAAGEAGREEMAGDTDGFRGRLRVRVDLCALDGDGEDSGPEKEGKKSGGKNKGGKGVGGWGGGGGGVGIRGSNKGGDRGEGRGATGDRVPPASGRGSEDPPSLRTAFADGSNDGEGGVTSRPPPSRGAWICAVTVTGSLVDRAAGAAGDLSGVVAVAVAGRRPGVPSGGGSVGGPTPSRARRSLACVASNVACDSLGPKCLFAQAEAISKFWAHSGSGRRENLWAWFSRLSW